MTRFINSKTKTIKLSDKESVEIKGGIEFNKYRELMQLSDYGKGDNSAIFIPLLKSAIVSWNLTDEAGVVVPYAPEVVDLLDTKTVMELVELILPNYVPDKKKS